MATARALRLAVSRPPSSARGSLLAAVVRRRPLSATPESGDAPSEDYTERPPRFSGAAEGEATTKGGHGDRHASTPDNNKDRVVPPFAPAGTGNKLGSHELADPAAAASFTQKRRLASSPSSREEATPGADEAAARKVREEDREYYRTHKPSPLAEIEFADTRKPITRATDGGAADRFADVPARVVEDTVDDSLARAEAMFREAAARGNPEWPHSRALAQMLARRNQGSDAGTGSASGAPWAS